MAGDPYAPHLERARALYSSGEVLQAGQIWQAILKKQPDHSEARAGLLQVKRWMDSRKVQEPAPAPIPAPEPAPAPPAPAPEPFRPKATQAYKSTVPYKPMTAVDQGPALEPGEEEPVFEYEAPPAAPASDDLEPAERLLKEGCTLYDMGQVEDALLKWDQILAQDPGHALALAYVAQARQELGYEPETVRAFPAPSYPAPPQQAVPPIEPEELLRRASQLYEMGSLEESIAALERILQVDPGNADAQGFIRLAKRELAESTPPVHQPPAPPLPPPYVPPAPMLAAPMPATPMPATPMPAAPVPAAPVPAAPMPAAPERPARLPDPPASARTSGFIAQPGRGSSDTLEQKLSQGERLLLLGRFEEAGFAFQMALNLNPDDPRAREGLQRVQARATLEPGRMEPTLPGVAAPAPKPVQPPASLTTPAPASRQGPELPRTLQDLSQHPLLGSTKFLVGGAALVILLGVGLQVFQKNRKDDQLRAAVVHARENAVAPLSMTAQTFDVNESVAAVRQEAETIMSYDPVRAYHRAKELLRRDAADAVGAALMEKAKAALLADPVPGVSLTEFQRLLTAGDLEGAERAIDALLRAKPDDRDLLQRAARLERVLAGLHASKGEWNEARTALQKGRAMFPEDKTWQARIHLLEQLRSMPKAEQPGWLPFLG